MPRKPVTDPHKAWNIAHHKRLEAYNKRIEALLNRAIAQSADLAMRHGAKATADTPFSYSQDRQLKAETEQLLKDLADDITNLTMQAETKEWQQAYRQATEYLSSIYDVAKQTEALQSLFDERLVGMKARNLDALRAFQERKIGGLKLSEKVWDYTKDFERQMEASIDMALLEGKSAEALSRDIRSLLTDPDTLFRRVRDKDTGELRMSRAMAAFHPGPGKYRSAYKNAMRLARSEINMAYRSSDSQTAQEFDACVGIRVNLSNNHTCNGKPFVDICDELDGDYPKSFIFRGWHPVCRCFITYILKTDEEFWRDLENGENNESVNTVHDVPDRFKEWVGKNEERIAKAEERGTLPYFLRDNESAWKGEVSANKMALTKIDIIGSTKLGESEMNEISESIRRVSRKIGLFDDSTAIDYTDTANGTLMEWHDGRLSISTTRFKLSDGTVFCPANDLNSAFHKLKDGKTLTFNEEYSIECLFHESVHAQASQRIIAPVGSLGDIIFESCTQLYARERYTQILDLFNVEAINAERIRYDGLGYQKECNLIRGVFTKDGIIQIGELKGIANRNEDAVKMLELLCKKRSYDYETICRLLTTAK